MTARAAKTVRIFSSHRRIQAAVTLALVGLVPASSAFATDIFDVQPAALDQPRIHAYISLAPGMDPQSFEGTFNIQAFFDTGASGVLLSANTAGYLGIQPSVFNGQEVIFSDVGVAGSSDFYVSNPIHIGLASYHPNTDVDNINTYQQVYNQAFSNIRAHIGPINVVDPNPLLADLDVFGVPLMQNKVVVMDPRPVDTFADTMRTYVYNPGTPFDEPNEATNPGIPVTSRSISLSYADVSRFTTVTPAGAPSATLATNPFIGPNPVLKLDTGQDDGTPPVKVGYNGVFTEGSFLLDTGAAASIISEHVAGALNIHYDPTAPEDDPRLLGVPSSEQFQLTIGGIGGTTKIAGFYLDSLLLRTDQGSLLDDNDPNHIRFLGAPVLVHDISVRDPNKNPSDPTAVLTLDGIFGMNFLVATAYLSEAEPFPIIDLLTPGNFKWVVYDEPARKLRLELLGARAPTGLTWVGDGTHPPQWTVGGVTWFRGFFEFVPYNDGDDVIFGDVAYDAQSFQVYLPQDVEPGSVFFANNDTGADFVLFGPGRIVGLTALTKSGTRSARIETANIYQGETEVYDGILTFAAPQDIGDVTVAGGKLVVETDQRFQRLAVQPAGEMEVLPNRNHVIDVTRLAVRGELDIADNSVVVRAGIFELADALLEVNEAIKNGRNGGTWDGRGIVSSAAAADSNLLTTVAVILNNDNSGNPFHTSFFGVPVDVDSILVSYAWVGDLNLDGVVGMDDYTIIDINFLLGQQDPELIFIYGDGDLDYNGLINSDDYKLMDRAFLLQSGSFPVAPPGAGASVPEPGVGLLLGIGTLLGLRRRRS